MSCLILDLLSCTLLAADLQIISGTVLEWLMTGIYTSFLGTLPGSYMVYAKTPYEDLYGFCKIL